MIAPTSVCWGWIFYFAETCVVKLRTRNVFVEYQEQTRIEGDIQQLSRDFSVTEMHRVINGEAKGRTSPAQLIIFDGVGFAIEDFSALRYVYQLMTQHLPLKELELIATPKDPRNLFGLFARSTTIRKVG